MSFDKAEARLKTIKKLQAQLKEYEVECYPRKEQKTYTIDAHSYDKAMKDLMRLSEENKKLKEEVATERRHRRGADEMAAEVFKRGTDIQAERDKLKEELRQKESTLHYYGCMWMTTGGDYTPTKEEIEDYLYRNVRKEDKEDVKRGLWEQFGYEEEEQD